jgi:hypothetical protein
MPRRAKFVNTFAFVATRDTRAGATSRFGPGWLDHEGPIAHLGHDVWRQTSDRFSESAP